MVKQYGVIAIKWCNEETLGDRQPGQSVATLKEVVERVHQNGDHLISRNTFRIRKPA